MRAARWPLILLSLLVTLLLGIRLPSLSRDGGEDPSHPDRGRLGPVLSPPPDWVEVARTPPEWGEIVDVAAFGEDVATLTSRGWQLNTGGATVTWVGSRTAGSPDWISRPTALALDSSRILVLDEGRSVILVWNHSGVRLGEIAIPFGSSYALRPTQLLLDPSNSPLVTTQRVESGGEAFWDVLSFGPDGAPRTVVSLDGDARSMVFGEPLLARDGSDLLSLSPLTHRLARLDLEEGSARPVAIRDDPPLWIVPRRHRREYRRMIQDLGGAAARLAELPEVWPSVRDFTVRGDGTLMVALSAGEDRVHIEILTPLAEPIGRYSLNGFADPVFLSGGRAFIAREGAEASMIYEVIPHGV
jgi:hypothetical protein